MHKMLKKGKNMGNVRVIEIKESVFADNDATSKAHLVLVLVFSKIRATFLPFKVSTKIPFFFFSLSSAARSKRYVISSSV